MTRPALYSEAAEQAVLSAMLLDTAVIPAVRETLTADSFDRPAHQALFTAMCGLVDHGSTVDPLTLSDALEADGTLTKAGGRDYVAYLVDVVPTAANWSHHAGIVKDLADRREAVRVCERAAVAAADRSVPLAQVARETTEALLPTAAATTRGGFVQVKDLAYAVLQDIADAHEGKASGLSWGYTAIDRATGGIARTEAAFLCSVPGGCKTALALNIARRAGFRGEGVGIFSAEMRDRSLVKRVLSNEAGVTGKAIRTGMIMDREFVDLGRAMSAIQKLPIWIDDTPEPDIDVIRARSRALKAKHPELAWLIVDFIQLVVSSQDSDDGRARELSRIAYALKGLAKELDVAVIATCQVDAAGIEKRSDKRPQLGDMQWSQAMRQAGDFVALLYRPAMYSDTAEDVLEVDFRKAREVEPFKVTLKWQGAFMRVENMGVAA